MLVLFYVEKMWRVLDQMFTPFPSWCAGRSLNVKKNDGIKESTDSSTIEDEDTKGEYNCTT